MSLIARKWIDGRATRSAGRGGRSRGRRGLGFELLERRALLATLQFAAGLGEQSTLDSVAQTPQELASVNSPNTKAFNQNDGTAFSYGTLTSAASTTREPGINLDILSDENVAKNGPANVSLQAGLADAIGNIGTTIPVTIVRSQGTPEKNGDPVDVQFAFSFNVKTFAANNATASFSYSVSYTYQGTTTPLAGYLYQLGGGGITPAGPGPVDLETGTLHAHIGDTFTLTFSEQFSGQT